MPADKTPGSDDLLVDFYQKFWEVVGFDVVNAFSFFSDTGKMPQSLKAISLL